VERLRNGGYLKAQSHYLFLPDSKRARHTQIPSRYRPSRHAPRHTHTLRQRHGGQRGRDTPRARQGARAGGSRRAPALPLTRAAAQAAHQSTPYSVLNSAKSECSSVVSLADFWRSPHAVHLARGREQTRSTPAEEAGAAKYCLTILASAGHFVSLAFHHASTSSSSRLLGLRVRGTARELIEHRGRIGGRDLLHDAGKVELCECCVKNIFWAFHHRKNPAGRPTRDTTGQRSTAGPQIPTRFLPRNLLVKNRGKEQPDTYLAPFLHYLQIVKST